MRILFIPSWYPDGGSFFLDQAIAVSKKGVNVDLLVNEEKSLKDFQFKLTNKKNSKTEQINDKVRVIKKRYYRIPKFERVNILLWTRSTYIFACKYVEEHGVPDLVHVHSMMWAGLAAIKLKERYKVQFVVTEHKSRFVGGSIKGKKLFKPYYIPKFHKILNETNKLIVVNLSMKKKLIDINNKANDKIIEIPNLVDADVFKPSYNKKINAGFTFVSIGLLEHVKGMDVLLNAFFEATKEKSQVKLKIIGEGSKRKELLEQAERLNLSDKVEFKGFLPRTKVVKELQNSDAFILATRVEAFGVVFIEALSCGLPVIGTRSGGPASIIKENNGLLIDADNEKQLKSAMLYMMDNIEKYNFEEIRRHCIYLYGEDNVGEKIVGVYKNVLKKS